MGKGPGVFFVDKDYLRGIEIGLNTGPDTCSLVGRAARAPASRNKDSGGPG